MYKCMHVCMYYVCMRLCTPIGAPFGALCAVDVSQVKYAHIENVCIYRRADYTGSTIYVTNLGVDMARFTQFHPMIPRWAIIYEIISPGATDSSIWI